MRKTVDRLQPILICNEAKRVLSRWPERVRLQLRRKVMAYMLSVAALVSSVLMAFAPTCALAQTRITVGVAAMSPRTIPLLIAQEQGLFAKHGIEARIVLIKGAPTLVASLISGDIEIGYTGGTAVLGAASQGLYLRILSSVSSKLTHTI